MFLERQFLGPDHGRPDGAAWRMGGVTCTMRVEPTDFVGWGIFQPISHSEAILVRPATMAQRRSYLDLFPQVRLIVCRRAGRDWFGSAASLGDQRIRLDGLAPIELAEEIQLFDCLRHPLRRFAVLVRRAGHATRSRLGQLPADGSS